MDNDPVDWSCAAVLGQERRMQIHRAAARRRENVGGQDAAVSHHERNVSVLFAKPSGKLARTYLGRLMYGKTELERGLLHGRRRDLESSARRPIGLTNNCGNFRYLRERAQRGNCNVWGAEEDRAHASRAYSPASFRAEAIV